MPSHAGREAVCRSGAAFQRYGAEEHFRRCMIRSSAQERRLSGDKSDEALVSIEINSGRSTKEHGSTLRRSIPISKPRARSPSLRLRDRPGWCDRFHRHGIRLQRPQVEKAMKDALKNDRAHPSAASRLGLMEMSGSGFAGSARSDTRSCPHCDGTGLGTASSAAFLRCG